MAHVWQTIEEAAVTLRISARTLHRRIAAGDYQSRLENGRREVLLDLPDTAGAAASNGAAPSISTPTPTTAEAAAPSAAATTAADPAPSADDAEPSTHWNTDQPDTALALAEERVRRTEVALAAYQMSIKSSEEQLRRTRSGALVAWCTVGALAAGALIATGWSVSRVTRAETQVRHLAQALETSNEFAAQWRAELDTSRAAVERFRDEAQQQRVIAARAEGELTAIKLYRPATPAASESQTPAVAALAPTTRPAPDATHASILEPASAAPVHATPLAAAAAPAAPALPPATQPTASADLSPSSIELAPSVQTHTLRPTTRATEIISRISSLFEQP